MNASVRSTSTGTGRTVLVIVAILSLLLSALALARPVIATEIETAADHCPGATTPGAPPGAIESSSGSITEDNVTIAWDEDPGVVTLTNANTTGATVVFCAKGGAGFVDGSKASGELTVVLAPAGEEGDVESVTFGTEISYFVLYDVTVEPRDDECTAPTAAQLKDAGSTLDPPTGSFEADPMTSTWGATLVVPEGKCVTVSFTSYTIDEDTGRIHPFTSQEVFDNLTDFYTEGTYDLTINVPTECGWQADLYIGELDLEPPHDNNALISWSAWEPGLSDAWAGCGGAADQFAVDLVKQDEEGMPLESVSFDLDGIGDGNTYATSDTSNEDGEIRFEGLLAGEQYLLTETSNPDETCVNDGPWTVTVGEDGSISIVDAEQNPLTATEGVFTIVNVCEEEEEEEEGVLEIDKFFCPSDSGTRVEFDVLGPVSPQPSGLGTQGVEEDDELPAGCERRQGVEFTIYVDLDPDPGEEQRGAVAATTETNSEGLIPLIDLEPGDYILVEDSTDASVEFEIEDNALTAIIVTNFESGFVKIIKLFCDADEENEDGDVAWIIDENGTVGDDDLPSSLEDCDEGDATFRFDADEDTVLVEDGLGLFFVEPGEHILTEISPNQSVSPAFDVEVAEDDEISADDPVTTVIVVNFEGEGEGPGEEEQGELVVIKFLCEGTAGQPTVSFDIGDPGELPMLPTGCDASDASFVVNPGGAELDTEASVASIHLDAGSYTLAETDPNVATSGTMAIEAGETTWVVVINRFVEDTEGGVTPGQGTPREGTAGGNPLPNTSTAPDPTGSLPAALLALVMLAGIGFGGYRMAAEARSRR